MAAIRTKYRSKLSSALSYPIGAEGLSAAIGDAPQLEILQLSFWDAHWPATKFRRALEARLPYVLMIASYSPAEKPGFIGSNAGLASGAYAERWELKVYPVLRELRPLARRLLAAEGLPAIAAWLRPIEERTRAARSQRIELTFDPLNESTTAAEFTRA